MEVFSTDNSFNTTTLITSTPGLITSISSSEKFTYFLNENGEVSGFGKQFKPFSLTLPFSVSTLSCGREHIAVLTQQLELFTWGNGESGALGLSNTESFSTPQKVALSSDFNTQEIVCGGWHTVILARYSAGKNFLLMCGRNSEGQLGTGKLSRELSPVRVQIPEEIKDIKGGNNFTMILTESGSVYMTGANQFGQLGIGHKKNICFFERLSIENVSQISCGNHSAAISNSKVYVWGTCSFGEYLKPTHITAIIGAEKVFVGDSVGVAIDSEKVIWMWGGKNPEGKARKTEFKADVISLNSGMHIFAIEQEKIPYRKKERSQTNAFIFNKPQLISPSSKKKKSFFNEVAISETPKCNPNYKGLRDFSSEKKNENAETSEKIKFFKEENEKLLVGSQGLTDRLNEKVQENFDLSEKMESLQSAISEKEGIIKGLISKLSSSEDQIEVLFKENEKLTGINLKLSADKERLIQSFQSDSEVKSYYEKFISELELARSSDSDRYKKELEKLKAENHSIQDTLASLRQENSFLAQSKKLIEQDLEKHLQENMKNEEVISELERKIIILQEQLNEVATANHGLYKPLEREKKSEKIISLSQLNQKFEEDYASEEKNSSPDLARSRKGLSPQHQDKMMRVAAEKMNIDDLTNDFGNYSSSQGHGVPSPIRVHKKSFEDVRNTIINLQKHRSSVHKDFKDYKGLFKLIRK